ncbi:MAG TPA: outer membrane protein assembly factor BamD [Sulfurimonas autotrophica]|nr:outer membrane protein assembly factor BamD [Sulfurimonas autotrophica]
MKSKHFFVFVLFFIILFTSCSKELDEYNKPAVYWYEKIVESISDGRIDEADDYYSSLQGEHIGSPLLPEATMILAIAHMHNEEYLLTEHFLNEYVRRYANANEKEFAEFLKIKAKYKALPNPKRNQGLILEAIKDAKTFQQNYPNSMYSALVDTMLTNLYLADASLNEAIADLYRRLGKPKAALYYKTIRPKPWINWAEIEPADTPWYREIFEGDGTASWYAFMVPDTQSVVSRNRVQSDENTTK